MAAIDDIKLLIGITDSSKDDLLSWIEAAARKRLSLSYLSGAEVPEALEYVITEVSVRRFNQIASEGYESHSVEGESISFGRSDFSDFEDDIYGWLYQQDEIDNNKGKVRFL